MHAIPEKRRRITHTYFFFFWSIVIAVPASLFSQNKQKTADARISIGSVLSPLLIIIIPPMISNTIKPKGTMILDKNSLQGERFLKQCFASASRPIFS